jgi:hypothetical protein
MTIKERAQIILSQNGWRRDPQPKSGKYAVYIRNGSLSKFYLGTHGAIRFGATQAKSYSMNLATLQAVVVGHGPNTEVEL